MSVVFCVLSISCCLDQPSSTMDAKKTGLEALRRKDYVAAYRLLLPIAEGGDHEAEESIGAMFLMGNGVERDVKAAVSWYERAAKGEELRVQRNLGGIYMTESEVQDLKKAQYWYGLAAERNDPESLGAMAVLELAVNQNREKSREWLTKAAEAGHVESMINLARDCVNGEFSPSDYDKAFYWFNQLATRDIAYGHNGLGLLYSKGFGVEADQKRAFGHFLQAAELGDATAQYNVGKIYLEGHGVEEDHDAGVQWLAKSALQANAHAVLYMANAYAYGLGVAENKVRAYVLYRLASSAIHNDELLSAIKSVEDSMTPEQIKEAVTLYEDLINKRKQIAEILPRGSED